jgi:hypothetical protein
VRAYEIVLHEEAWAALAAAGRAKQRRIFQTLDEVKNDPFREGDFQEMDATGRVHQVLLMDDWLITYWTDHGACEVRVVRLEQVTEE